MQAQEALRRAKFKFAGRQKIVVSRNWGFTKFARADYVAWKKAGRLINDGVNAKVPRGWALFASAAVPGLCASKQLMCLCSARSC